MKRRLPSAGLRMPLAAVAAASLIGTMAARADFATVKTLAGQVVNLSSKVANGTITAAEQATLNGAKAALAGQNNVLNDLGLLGVKGGGIDTPTYDLCQQAYVDKVTEIVKQKAAEQGVAVEVQAKPVKPDGTVKVSQAGADLDLITDAKSPEQVKAIQDSVNQALQEYVAGGGKKPANNLLQQLNIDIMVKPEGVTAEQMETISGLNNDAYKTKGAAAHEAAVRAGETINVPNALDHAGEMLAFGAKKNNLAAVMMDEMVKLQQNPETQVQGTPAYEHYKTIEATFIKATHLEQKYIDRLAGDVKAIAEATGVEPPPSSTLPAAGANRVPGEPGKAFAGNALSDALIQQQVKNLAEVLSGQGAKNPAAAGQAYQQAAGFAQILPDSAKGQLIDEVRVKYGDTAAKGLADAFKKIPSSTSVGFTPAPGGIFGDGSFKLTDTQVGAAGTALTAAGHLMLLLEASKVAGTMAGQIENENYVGAAGTAGGFAASTWLTLKGLELVQGGVTSLAPGVAPYLPAVMAGMISFGLTSQLLESITTADGKTLNEHIQGAMAGYAQEYEQVDIAGTAAEADQQQTLIKLVKSGYYKPKNGMTVAQAWQALSSGKALKNVLQPTFAPGGTAASGAAAASASDVKQAAWEKAVADGLLKSDQYELFEKGYDPAKGAYTPPKDVAGPADLPKAGPSPAGPARPPLAGGEDVLCKKYDIFSIKEGVALYARPDGTPYLRIYENRRFDGPYRVVELDRPVMINNQPVGGTLELPDPPPNISGSTASISYNQSRDYLSGPWVYTEITPPGSAKPGFAYVNPKGTRAFFNVELHAGTAAGTPLQVSYEVNVPGPDGTPPPWSVHGLYPSTPLGVDSGTRPLATVTSSGGRAESAGRLSRPAQPGAGPPDRPAAPPVSPAQAAPEAAERNAMYEAQVAALLAAHPAGPPSVAAPDTAESAGYAAAIEQALKTAPTAPPVAAPPPRAPVPAPAPARPTVSVPAPRAPTPPVPLPAPAANANVLGTWSRQEANIRETVTFNPGGSGSSKVVILDARVRGYVGDTVTPFSYTVSGNQVTVRTPSGAATGTVSGNSLNIGGKTYHR